MIRGAIRSALMWLRLAFMLPTHRIVKLAPQMYLQIPRGTSDASVAATLAATVKNMQQRKGKVV